MTEVKPALLVVGGGVFGLTIAELVARKLGLRVHIVDARNHLGGNAYSYADSTTGIEVHQYGSHLFHTSNKDVWKYVNTFSDFNDYRHSVISYHKGQFYPMPINLQTISLIYGKAMTPDEAQSVIQRDIHSLANNFDFGQDTFESRALSTIGPTLYNALIRDYTHKQWQTPPNQLPASTFSRLPVRLDHRNGYFSDKWQGLPIDGYGALFDRMVDNPLITFELGTDYFESKWNQPSSIPIVFTGPMDRYFNYRHGRLGWRTLDFQTELLRVGDFQGASVVNYPDLEFEYTRIHEFRHLRPEKSYAPGLTIIAKEFSRWAGLGDEPFYPVNSQADREILKRYRDDAMNLKGVIFGGRLGTYQYLDMHMAISSALTTFKSRIEPQLLNA